MRIFYFLFCFLFSFIAHAQFSNIDFSTGIVVADLIKTDDFGEIKHGNTPSLNFYASVEVDYQLAKFLKISGALTYQERRPLEVLFFAHPERGYTAVLGFGMYPTHKNHKYFDDSYKEFPNFKYTYFELFTSVFKEFKNGFQIEGGVGGFAGILINQNAKIVFPEDLPNETLFFGEPFNFTGQVQYRKYDYGLLPKLSLSYKVYEKIYLNFAIKGYFSLSRLHLSELVGSGKDLWVAGTAGFGVSYLLD